MALVIDGLKNNAEPWNSINWGKVNREVNRLQVRIVKAEKLLPGA